MDRSPSIDPPDGHCQYARLSFEYKYKQYADHGHDSDVVVSYGIPITVARVGGSDDIFSSQISPWITSFFALSLTTNVLATSECFTTSSLHETSQLPFPFWKPHLIPRIQFSFRGGSYGQPTESGCTIRGRVSACSRRLSSPPPSIPQLLSPSSPRTSPARTPSTSALTLYSLSS